MKCQICGRQATLHLIDMPAGVRRERHVCARCAAADPQIQSDREEAVRLVARLAKPKVAAEESVGGSPTTGLGVLNYAPQQEGDESPPHWFALGIRSVQCVACRERIDQRHRRIDLQPAACPHCGVSCLLFNWVDQFVQVVPSATPPAFRQVLVLLQDLPPDDGAQEVFTYFDELLTALRQF